MQIGEKFNYSTNALQLSWNADETFIVENYKHQGGLLHKSLDTRMYNSAVLGPDLPN